jgi:hypothetical protein
MFLQFAFADEGDTVQNFGGVCLQKVFADFFDEMVGDSDNDDVLHEFIVVKNFLDPAAATEDSFETGWLHVGMVIEYDKVERFLNAVRPELTHVMVIAVIEEVDAESACCRSIRSGCIAFVHHLVEGILRFVIAVAVCTFNLCAVQPMNVAVRCNRFPQPLHKGLLGVNASEILNGDYRHLDSNINLFAEALAESAILTKRMAQFVLLETFA